jgi:putative oxidoreductase
MFLYALGHFILRVGIGLLFIFHGYPNIAGGTKTWLWLGSQMSYFGITFAPVFWGCMAACAQFFGGICLVAGFYTRVAAFFIACTMCVAIIMHLNKGDSFTVYSHPLSNLIIMVSLMFMGGGIWSLYGW